MAARTPRLAVLVSPVMLALVCLPSPAAAAYLHGAPCLSAEVGAILSAKLQAHAFDGALPAGWVIEEVNVARDHIDLGTRDAARRPHRIALRPGTGPEEAADGRGRSFAFVIDVAGAPLDAAGRQGLLDLAARVDAAIPEEEAQRVCAAEGRSAHPSPSAGLRQGPRWLRVGAAFFAVAILAAVAGAWRCRRYLVSREAIFPAALTLLALALRFVARAGPGDIREVLGAGMGEGYAYRAGWSALLHLLFNLLPPRYETIWMVHRVVGALAVPLLYSALRQRFPQRSIAAAGAAALAVLPLAARFSASDTPYVPLCTAFLAAIVALTRFRQSGSRGALALGLVLLTAAMHLRPDGPWLIVPVLLLVLSVPAVAAGRAFGPSAIVGGGLFLAANAIPSLWALAGHNRFGDGSLRAYASETFILFGTLHGSPWADLGMSPWPLSLLVLGGLVVAARSGRSGVGWLAATVVAMPLRFPATEQYANARYHLPAATLACGLAGLAAAHLVERAGRRWGSRFPVWLDARVAAAVLVLVAAIPRLDLLRRTWTPQEEFDFYREGLKRIGADCTVVALTEGQDAGFVPFSDPEVEMPVDIGVFLARPWSPSPACTVYYRAANCRSADAVGLPSGASFGENPACQEIEQRATLVPIVEASLRARPYRGERYSVDPIPVGFYRIVDLAQAR